MSSELGQPEGRLPGSSSQQDQFAIIVHGASRSVYLGPYLESEGAFKVTARTCRGMSDGTTYRGVICNFDELQKVPGIRNARRCPNCTQT